MEVTGKLACPRDGGRLSKIGFMGLNLDSCPNCDGVWLDEGELARLHGLSEDILAGPPAVDPQGTAGCPHCGRTMDTRLFSRQSKVVVDQCASCMGVWLDQSELARILQEVNRIKQTARVFVSGSGRKYHSRGCRHLGSKTEEISFNDAQKRRLTACRACKPPQLD